MKIKIVIGVVLINLVLLSDISIAQWLDPEWKKDVVLFEAQEIRTVSKLEIQQIGKKCELVKVQKADTSFRAIGTGFIVVYKKQDFIVTNKHIAEMCDSLKSNQMKREKLFIRFNLKSKFKPSVRFSVDSLISFSKLTWGEAKNADIAVLPFVVSPEVKDSLDLKSIGISLFKDWDYINEGDDVYILGFPLRIGAGEFYSPVVRSGIIALKEKRGEFLIDSNIFPGNSGGPVFMKSYIYDYRTRTVGEITPSYLIGIVSSYISYTDTAISVQTGRPRITFEENSGLGKVFSSEQIVDLLKTYVEDHKL